MGNFEHLIRAQQQGNLIAVTNGSFKNNRGVATWIICDKPNTQIQIKGNVPMPGEEEYQHSTRTELSSIYRIVAATKVFTTICPSGKITVGCNSTETLQKVSKFKQLKANTTDYNLTNVVK